MIFNSFKTFKKITAFPHNPTLATIYQPDITINSSTSQCSTHSKTHQGCNASSIRINKAAKHQRTKSRKIQKQQRFKAAKHHSIKHKTYYIHGAILTEDKTVALSGCPSGEAFRKPAFEYVAQKPG